MSVNHLGEPEQQTWSGWRRACNTQAVKLAQGSPYVIKWDGDKDICECSISVYSKTYPVGHWGGDVGCIYKRLS